MVRDTLIPHSLQIKAKPRDQLQLGDGFVVSTDIWTKRRRGTVSWGGGLVTCLIDGKYKGHMVLLSYKHIQGHHTAEAFYLKY